MTKNVHFKNGTFYHQTGGGAEYLSTTFVECPNGEKEGTSGGVYARIDGGEFELCVHQLQRMGFKSIKVGEAIFQI